MKLKSYLLTLSAFLSLILGISLTGINIYGEFQQIRPKMFFADELRFENDLKYDLAQTLALIERQPGETDKAYATRLTQVIADGLAHIHWRRFDSRKFNQLIPIWENYLLYFMGLYSGIPEYQRYHFADYRRSLERGIGICGDAAMIMSQLLEKHGINNQLISFPGHVILAAKFNDGSELSFDPDFGVALMQSPADLTSSLDQVLARYGQAGYRPLDLTILTRIYSGKFQRWDGVKHFITKKYYFEKLAYAVKWPLPLLLILFAVVMLKYSRSIKDNLGGGINGRFKIDGRSEK